MKAPSRYAKKISNQILELMEQQGRNRVQLAAVLGRSPGAVTMLSQGLRPWKVEELDKVFIWLGFDAAMLSHGKIAPVIGRPRGTKKARPKPGKVSSGRNAMREARL